MAGQSRGRYGGLNPWKSSADARQLGYRSTYDFRKHQGDLRGFSASQAVGKPAPGEQSISATYASSSYGQATIIVRTPTGSEVRTVDLNRADLRRASRHSNFIQDLRANRITPVEFERKAKRIGLVAGEKLVTDPRAVIATSVTIPKGQAKFESGRRQPRRSRRAA